MLGWPTKELIETPYVNFIHPEDRAETIRVGEEQRKGNAAIEVENRYRCRDGSYRGLMWNATPLVYGPIYAMAGDITEAKLTKQELVSAKELAERTNKFKDQFLSTMSHELRTPLNAVIGFSDLITDDRYGPLNERQRRYVNHIQTGGKHLLTLINDILDLSRIEAGRLQLAIGDVRLDPCIAEACDTLQPLIARKSHSLIKHRCPELSVRADSTRLSLNRF